MRYYYLMSFKVFFLIGQLGCGGEEKQLYILLKLFKKNKLNTSVLVWNYHPTDFYCRKIKKIKINIVPIVGNSKIGKINFIRKVINKDNPDLLHNFSFYLNFVCWLSTILSKTISVGSIRSSLNYYYSNLKFARTSLSILFPKKIITNNYFSLNEIKKTIFFWKNIEIIENGLDNPVSVSKVTNKISKPYIFASGSLIAIKRWDRLIEVGKLFKKEKIKLKIIIAGSGPLENELSEEIIKNNLSQKIHLIGQVDNIAQLLAQARFVVHPSNSEGSSNIIMEALSLFKPVIAFDVGDNKRMIKNYKNGYLIPFDNEQLFYKRIIGLAKNKKLISIMSHANLDNIIKNYSSEKYFRSIINYYQMVLINRKAI